MTITELTRSQPWLVAGWTMLHFLWVDGAIGLAAALVRRMLRRAGPQANYRFALVALMTLAVAPAVISFRLTSSARSGAPRVETSADTVGALPTLLDAPADQSPAMTASGSGSTTRRSVLIGQVSGARFERFLAFVAARLPWLWLAGAPAIFALLATGLVGTERLRRQSRILTEGDLVDQCRRLADTLGLTRPVALGICDRLVTPIVLGVVRPMILLPPVALGGWNTELVEMVLLHELAHVRRLDILAILFQRMIESILFFHPAVWIVSGWVRLERERCCDRMVVDRTGRPMSYATALFSLFDSVPSTRAATAAMSRNHLVDRIRWILDPEDHNMQLTRTTLALLSVLFLIPALLIGSQVAPPGPRDERQSARTGTQEQNVPARPKFPGRIVAEAFRMGAPASKERVAGVTGVIEIGPESGQWRLICDRRGRPRISPDGQTVAILEQAQRLMDSSIWTVSSRGTPAPVKFLDLPGLPVWSPDGKQFIISAAKNQTGHAGGLETWRMDTNGKDRTKLPLAATDQVVDWSSRGQLLVMRRKEGRFYVAVVGLDGTEPHPMNLGGANPRFSPDGRKIVYASRSPQGGSELTISDIDGGNRRQINFGKDVSTQHACWSPDGRWLAVSLMTGERNKAGRLTLSADAVRRNPRIEIVDLDGKERHPIRLPAGDVLLGDWR